MGSQPCLPGSSYGSFSLSHSDGSLSLGSLSLRSRALPGCLHTAHSASAAGPCPAAIHTHSHSSKLSLTRSLAKQLTNPPIPQTGCSLCECGMQMLVLNDFLRTRKNMLTQKAHALFPTNSHTLIVLRSPLFLTSVLALSALAVDFFLNPPTHSTIVIIMFPILVLSCRYPLSYRPTITTPMPSTGETL